MQQKFITKFVRFFIIKCDSFITKCDSYYKLRRFYWKMRYLLQNATFITNFDSTNSDPKHVDLSSNSVVSAVDKSKITQAF